MRLVFCLTAVVRCSLQEDSPVLCAGMRLNGRKPSSDEEVFLQRLYDYMEEKQTPIGRIPTLGFQKGNKIKKVDFVVINLYSYKKIILLMILTTGMWLVSGWL